jgi:hypothetical protein
MGMRYKWNKENQKGKKSELNRSKSAEHSRVWKVRYITIVRDGKTGVRDGKTGVKVGK